MRLGLEAGRLRLARWAAVPGVRAGHAVAGVVTCVSWRHLSLVTLTYP
jgi:hypothetical protein